MFYKLLYLFSHYILTYRKGFYAFSVMRSLYGHNQIWASQLPVALKPVSRRTQFV